jgi:hypothetical protein
LGFQIQLVYRYSEDSGGFRRDLRLLMAPPVLDVLVHLLGPQGLGGALAAGPLVGAVQVASSSPISIAPFYLSSETVLPIE